MPVSVYALDSFDGTSVSKFEECWTSLETEFPSPIFPFTVGILFVLLCPVLFLI